jgi:hypothetical protein
MEAVKISPKYQIVSPWQGSDQSNIFRIHTQEDIFPSFFAFISVNLRKPPKGGSKNQPIPFFRPNADAFAAITLACCAVFIGVLPSFP